jgi:hypothetical protein
MQEKKRTITQNSAMHLLFDQLATELNDAGLDMKRTLKPEVDIPWSKETVKEFIWRPIMIAQLNKKSTTELTTKEIDKIFETLSKHLGEKLGIQIDFPSIESLLYKQNKD